jgi:hypothetical protein
MNYRIRFCSKISETFDTIMKLVIETAAEADYAVKTYSEKSYAPFSSILLNMHFIGSAKKKPIEAVLDFDSVYIGNPVDIYISPKQLAIPYDGLHYWGVAGTVFRIIGDLSPALVTNYLLEKGKDKELVVFKQYSLKSLPTNIQEILRAAQKE